PSLASSPFDHPKADVFLRSADGMYFRVFKLFLSLASPFFEAMFSLPQPDNADGENRDGLPVIPVSESSKTLDSFLKFCYPSTLAEDPDLIQLDDVVDIIEASRKYEVPIIEKRLGRALSIPSILEQDPYRCFAIACRSGMQKEAELAAPYTLRLPLIPPMFPEIKMISSTQLLDLLSYHSQCSMAVSAVCKNHKQWIEDRPSASQLWLTTYKSHFGRCRATTRYCFPYNDEQFNVVEWWADYMDEILPLVQDRPCKSTITGFPFNKIIEKVQALDCTTCAKTVRSGVVEFNNTLAMEVEKATSNVRSL
ncbi:hypothetical protein CONPUDRAFT_26165, partial [Coniophora puteana RWD-64-598 SS2]